MPAQPRFEHISLIKLDHAGDVLWTTPTVATLRANFPAARISVCCTDYTAPVWQNNPAVDDIIAISPPDRRWPHFLPRPDLTLCLDTRTPAVRLTYASGAAVRSGYYYFPRGLSVLWPLLLLTAPVLHPASRGDFAHEVEVNRRLLERLGCQTNSTASTRLFLTEQELQAARQFLQQQPGHVNRIAVHLPRKWTDGGWPPEHVARLINLLAANFPEYSVLLSCGPGEEPLLEAVTPLLSVPALTITGKSFRDWAAMLKQCSLLVCRDCGPVHVAAALDVPVVSIFEESKRKEHMRWEPWLVPHRNVFRPDLFSNAAAESFYQDSLDSVRALLYNAKK